MIAPMMTPTTVNSRIVVSTQTITGVETIMIVQTMFQVDSDSPESKKRGMETEEVK